MTSLEITSNSRFLITRRFKIFCEKSRKKVEWNIFRTIHQKTIYFHFSKIYRKFYRRFEPWTSILIIFVISGHFKKMKATFMALCLRGLRLSFFPHHSWTPLYPMNLLSLAKNVVRSGSTYWKWLYQSRTNHFWSRPYAVQ